MNVAEVIGRYFLFRFRRRLEATSVRKVALQLKKQGVPLPITRLIVFGIRRPDPPVLTDVIDKGNAP